MSDTQPHRIEEPFSPYVYQHEGSGTPDPTIGRWLAARYFRWRYGRRNAEWSKARSNGHRPKLKTTHTYDTVGRATRWNTHVHWECKRCHQIAVCLRSGIVGMLTSSRCPARASQD